MWIRIYRETSDSRHKIDTLQYVSPNNEEALENVVFTENGEIQDRRIVKIANGEGFLVINRGVNASSSPMQPMLTMQANQICLLVRYGFTFFIYLFNILFGYQMEMEIYFSYILSFSECLLTI